MFRCLPPTCAALSGQKITLAKVVLELLQPAGAVFVALARRTAAVREAPYEDVLAYPLREELAPRPYQAIAIRCLHGLLKLAERRMRSTGGHGRNARVMRVTRDRSPWACAKQDTARGFRRLAGPSMQSANDAGRSQDNYRWSDSGQEMVCAKNASSSISN
jgi:hypothetical protein